MQIKKVMYLSLSVCHSLSLSLSLSKKNANILVGATDTTMNKT
jgi:hypothetical protein